MNLINLHRKYSFIDYQNQICSIAAVITIVTVLVSIILPFVWIFKINGNKFSTNHDVAIFEQPNVKFQYDFIVLAENALDDSKKVFLCSSFDFLRNFDENSEKCSKFKFVEKDENYDGIVDEMTFSFDFHTMYRYGLRALSIVLFLDTRITHQCDFKVPSAIIINKFFSNNYNDRNIFITGSLQPIQIQPLVCPFFLRNIKSHFFFENINENLTSLEDFRPSKIRETLENNPLHFEFQESLLDFQHLNNDKTNVVIKVKISEVAIRYRKSFWTMINEVWINYVAVFCVTLFIANFLLNLLFENRWLTARRKRYLQKDN